MAKKVTPFKNIFPTDQERVELAMLVSGKVDFDAWTDIVAALDITIDKIKAGLMPPLNASSDKSDAPAKTNKQTPGELNLTRFERLIIRLFLKRLQKTIENWGQ
jgi:hypothetical protein